MSLKDSDSYRDFELYLEQVNNEIMRVFEDLNLTFNLESHNTEIVSPTKGVLIDTTKELIQNEQILLQSPNIKEFLSNYRIQNDNKNDDILIKENNVSNNWNKEFSSFAHLSHCFPNELSSSQWMYKEPPMTSSNLSMDSVDLNFNEATGGDACTSCSVIPNANLSGKRRLQTSGTNIISFDNFHSRSLDELHSLSWLYWQQNLSMDYLPVVPVPNRVTVEMNKRTSSQLERHLAEIEAQEVCKWLRAAGFPQYAQMYEEMQFPIDVGAAQYDHPLLEPAVLQSLFRRLHALNRCAHICQQPCSRPDDSEDEQCALSDNWTYQSDLRRWSRTCETDLLLNTKQSTNEGTSSKFVCENKNKHSTKHEIGTNILSSDENKLLRRAATTRFKHHREGVVVDVNSMSDIFLKRFGSIKYGEQSAQTNLEYTSIIDVDAQEDDISLNTDSQGNFCEVKENAVWSDKQKIETVIEENLDVPSGKPIISLSCTQLQKLRKLALLKLTAHIEKYCPSHRTGWNWELPKFIKKMRTPAYKEIQLLSLPLTVVLQRTGQPLPKAIQEALEWLRTNGSDQVGIFRKPGVRSRIQSLRTLVENQKENINFIDQQPYDVADMIKQYFRELPEAVLTSKFSETFMLIFQYVPPYLRREAIICTLLLMTDEHREVLQAILYFLLRIAKCSDVNQMNENNLAICFAPSLFQYNSHSTFCRQGLGSPNARELLEIKAAQECLLYLLKNNSNIFKVPIELLNQCKLSELNDSVAVQLSELGSSTEGGWQGYMQECHQALLREVREKNRGWIMVSCAYPKIELSYKKVEDGHPLRLWKVCVDVEAPPAEVLHRILRERHIWDDDLHSAKIIAQMSKTSEVFHYVCRNIEPLPYVDYCVIRTWNTDARKGTCAIVETSVEHPDIPNIPNTVRGIVLASRYFIEHGGSGRSRVLHLSRVDMRGRIPEWYHKNFGHLYAIHAAHIQSSFRQSTTGPESKV